MNIIKKRLIKAEKNIRKPEKIIEYLDEARKSFKEDLPSDFVDKIHDNEASASDSLGFYFAPNIIMNHVLTLVMQYGNELVNDGVVRIEDLKLFADECNTTEFEGCCLSYTKYDTYKYLLEEITRCLETKEYENEGGLTNFKQKLEVYFKHITTLDTLKDKILTEIDKAVERHKRV